MGTLFSNSDRKSPLAERVRPRQLSEVEGQQHILGKNGPLRKIVADGQVHSLIFWGPPGTGKTTVGQIISSITEAKFVHLSAALTGVKEVRKILRESENKFELSGRRDLLFIDEIHRFNKAQQDVLLPFLEEGSIIFIGATTENPSFEVNSAILSRSQVFVFEKLERSDVKEILRRALEHEEGLNGKYSVTNRAFELIVDMSDGDARRALNILELSSKLLGDGKDEIDRGLVANSVQKKSVEYDKEGEEHYNLISALHKTIRNSDPDAALYWLARMLEGGEDPVYIARRLVRVASEDVGLADPRALSVAAAGKDAVELIGMPECDLALAQVVVYLSLASKSNSLYKSYIQARKDVREKENFPVPLELRNAPTDLMKELGYGKGYKYTHDFEEKTTPLQGLPDNLVGRRYYRPKSSGYENELKKRLEEWRKRRTEMGK